MKGSSIGKMVGKMAGVKMVDIKRGTSGAPTDPAGIIIREEGIRGAIRSAAE